MKNNPKKSISIFWFRRDLRLEDNTALYKSLESGNDILPLFIFDDRIIDELPKNDPRLLFILESLEKINKTLKKNKKSILCQKGTPKDVWEKLILRYDIKTVYANKDYEPYAIKRDSEIKLFLKSKGISFQTFKDQVIFEENEVLKNDGKPYTVFTPYKNKWLDQFQTIDLIPSPKFENLLDSSYSIPTLNELGLTPSTIKVLPYTLEVINDYEKFRDFPSVNATSYLSPHLRFGTLSIRQLVRSNSNSTFLSELIWREFFMQILFHFPYVVNRNFKSKYDRISWRNNEMEFERWKEGQTGYPLVDAGMKQLNQTGYMHNRVRMITASFLCKHLLIDWRWGEAYFARNLLDYDLSANNGNWQWVAGTGCDAAPYFRIFNPSEQLKKFDKNLDYVKKWLPDFSTANYPQPMVDHKLARERALSTYKKGLS